MKISIFCLGAIVGMLYVFALWWGFEHRKNKK